MSDAQLLQCPDCEHRHDIRALGDVATFLCHGCQRPLKVPAALRTSPPTASSAGAASAAAGTNPTPGPPNAAANPGRAAALEAATERALQQQPIKVALWLRLVIWVVAVPVGLAVVFRLASAFGFIDSNQLIDTFAESGWSRFAPIARVLPFAALLIATIVQCSVLLLERRERAKVRSRLTASASADRLEAGHSR